MVHCPECAAALDIDEDDVEEGETLTCPECEVDLEVVSTHPLDLNVIPEEDDEEDEEDDLDEEDDEDEDEDLDDEGDDENDNGFY